MLEKRKRLLSRFIAWRELADEAPDRALVYPSSSVPDGPTPAAVAGWVCLCMQLQRQARSRAHWAEYKRVEALQTLTDY